MQKAAKVVVVVFDGLRPDMVTPDLMPNLAAFGGQSIWFREARSVFPSMTRVATTSIATGAPPAVHGVVGNAFYFPEVTRDFVLDTSNASDVALAEGMTGGNYITTPTFADALASKGLTFATVHAGSAGSAYAINPRAAANAHWTFSVMGEAATRTPMAVREMVARFGPLPPRTLPRFEETDYIARVFNEYVLTEMQPDVALIWFNEPDTSFHYKLIGSDETRDIMRHVDLAFARILATLRTVPDAEDIAIIVASDHGQISSSGAIDLAGLLTDAGHPAAKASARNLVGAKLAITGGNMGEIRVLDGDMDRRDTVARWLMAQDFIGMVFTPSDDPVRGSVEGTFSTRLVSLDHARQPELVYVLRSDDTTDAHGLPGLGLITGGVPVGGGMHGGLNRYELNTVLMLSGSGISGRSGISKSACGIIDIGPTILNLLGVQAPAAMRGESLLGLLGERPADAIDIHEVGIGAFRQRMSIVQRGAHRFPWQGGRTT